MSKNVWASVSQNQKRQRQEDLKGVGVEVGGYCKRFAQSAGPLVSFSRILQYLGLTVTILGALLEALLQSWDHFWSTFGYMFRIMAPQVPQEAPTRKSPHPFGYIWEVIFKYFCTFDEKTAYLKHICFFCDLFVASSAFRDGLTCNPYAPAQSKRTFSVSYFF